MTTLNSTVTNTFRAASANSAIPTTVYSQHGKLYVHAGGQFKVIAAVGNYGQVNVAGSYPAGFGVKTDTRWTQDSDGIAAYAAKAINAHPVLISRVAELEKRQADLVAKLKIAQAALQRKDGLGEKYISSLVAMIDQSLAAVKSK